MKKLEIIRDTGAQGAYRRMLMEKKENVLAGLGVKFDTLAKMGRIAEEDQAQLSHDEFVSLRLNSLDHLQLRMVNEALDRLEAGDFGTCLSCDQEIPAKRLKAVPWARYCVACQDEVGALEQTEQHETRFRPVLPLK